MILLLKNVSRLLFGSVGALQSEYVHGQSLHRNETAPRRVLTDWCNYMPELDEFLTDCWRS